MRVLVTGASGFVGPHLIKELRGRGHDVLPTALNSSAYPCDLLDKPAVDKLIGQTRPDAVVHLAGLTHVGESWKDPSEVINANVLTTDHLCAAVSKRKKPAIFLMVSTAMVYDFDGGDSAFDENSATGPKNPYGESKLTAESIAKKYESKSFRVYVVRPFNHTGPGQSTDFAVPGFAARISKAKRVDAIVVGNINVKRDFSDVRDIVQAYRLILEKKPVERMFVLGSGRAVLLKNLLEELAAIARKKISFKVDKSLLRPADPRLLISSPLLAEKVLGWKCRIPLKKTLADVYASISTK